MRMNCHATSQGLCACGMQMAFSNHEQQTPQVCILQMRTLLLCCDADLPSQAQPGRPCPGGLPRPAWAGGGSTFA